MALQNDGCRDFPAADGGDQLVEVGNLPNVGELVQNQPYMDRQSATVFIIRTVTQQVDKLALKHGKNEVEGGVGKENNGSSLTAVCPKPYQKKDRVTKVTTVKVP